MLWNPLCFRSGCGTSGRLLYLPLRVWFFIWKAATVAAIPQFVQRIKWAKKALSLGGGSVQWRLAPSLPLPQGHWSLPGPAGAGSPSRRHPSGPLEGALEEKGTSWGVCGPRAGLHQGVRPFSQPPWERPGRPGREAGERALPSPPGKPVCSAALRSWAPLSTPFYRKSPLTEDDDEPHDEGQGGEDQAPIADGLVVWGRRGRGGGMGDPRPSPHPHSNNSGRWGHITQGWERPGTVDAWWWWGWGVVTQEGWEEGPPRLTVVEWVHVLLGAAT